MNTVLKITFLLVFLFVSCESGEIESNDETDTDNENMNENDVDVIEIISGDCTNEDVFCHIYKGNSWSDKVSGTYNYEEAKQVCIDIGGRLPTISELRTLIINCEKTEFDGTCSITEENSDYSEHTSECDGCEANSNFQYSVFDDTEIFFSSTYLEVTPLNIKSPYTTPAFWSVAFNYAGLSPVAPDLSLSAGIRCIK